MAKSRFLKFKNTKFTDYFVSKTNRVLDIDDISDKFSNSDDSSKEYSTNILNIDSNLDFNRYLIQVRESEGTQNQLTEIISIGRDNNVDLIRSSITSDDSTPFADFSIVINDIGEKYLEFIPNDEFDKQYEIKLLNSSYSLAPSSGQNTIGFTDSFACSKLISSYETQNLFTLDKNTYSSLFIQVSIVGSDIDYNNFVKLYVYYDGQDINLSEVYADNFVGSNREMFGSFSINIVGDDILVDYINNSNYEFYVRAKTVSFGDINSGIGTYRFLSKNQPIGSEKSAIYDCFINNTNYSAESDPDSIDILSIDSDLFTSAKSLIEIGIGNTASLHELTLIHDGTNISITQYPFLTTGEVESLGLGTFGATYFGNNLIVKFYPDPEYPLFSETFKVLSYNEKIYKILDTVNVPDTLIYSPVNESIFVYEFYGKNVVGFDETEFKLYSDDYPIFSKEFDPSDANILDKDTGIFTIKNHFFSNLERLIYTPKSTFDGVGEVSVGIGTTLNSLGILTDKLPQELYVIKINPDQFKLSTRKDYAEVGIYVTFTSNGEGNAHSLEMYEKNSKTIICIDEVIQYPLLWTPLNYSLENNGGQVSIGASIICLSGISSITPKNLLKINDEYVYINNVGFGTSSSGPISFGGTFPLVEVERGFVGTSQTSHNDGDNARVYRGSYNIVGNTIYFTQPPRGLIYENTFELYGLEREKSSFSGRVFLKSDYNTNVIYDDISDNFTGLDSDYEITVQGISTTGIGVSGGNGILLINGIFQTPTTETNKNNNFEILEDDILGISTVSFTGITSSTGELYISSDDVNKNQLPRGGMIISIGYSGGLGYAPLVGAAVSAVVVGGSINNITTNTDFGSYGSGYRSPVSIGITYSSHTGSDANIDVIVGAGGTLSFNIISGGSGYVSPKIIIPPPSYENLPVEGVSRLGIGQTTDTGINLLVNVELSAASTTGIGSTTFEVSGFKISRNGYGFKKGDVFKPIGLVTAAGLSEPIEELVFYVDKIFTDSFALWNFGNLYYIDSIKNYQNGTRKTFPLYYNSSLLSFTKDSTNEDSILIDMNNLLLIFINGVLQVPGESYEYDGGPSFTFTQAPKFEDSVSIFFYVGVEGIDSEINDIVETVKIGDSLQTLSNNQYLLKTFPQDKRLASNFSSVDTVETPIYAGPGISDEYYRPTNWIKQKRDINFNGQFISKVRDSIESQIYPTSRLIKDYNSVDNEIFLDNILLFEYDSPNKFDLFLIENNIEYRNANISANVGLDGSLSSLQVNDSGNGYEPSSTIDLIISSPIGIGSTAIATATVAVDSQISNTNIISPGFGYTSSNPPKILIPQTLPNLYSIKNISNVEGFSGNIIGIGTTTGVGGHPLAISFELDSNIPNLNQLQVGYWVYISNTIGVGMGITSVNANNSDIIGISTLAVDNIYYVHAIDNVGGTKIISNILSTTNTSGIQTSNILGVGNISWGRLSGFDIDTSENISFIVKSNTISGLSTYPILQRRAAGLRNTGSIKKEFN